MKLIESNVEIIPQESGLEGIYKQCELAGRTAYKSQDRITEGSAKKFVDAMMKSNHGAVLEHGTVYLYIPYDVNQEGYNYIWNDQTDRHYDPYVLKYQNNAYTRVHYDGDFNAHITTNLRVLFENGWMDDLQYLSEPTEYHEKRVTVKFICSRSVSHEAVRHRTIKLLVA